MDCDELYISYWFPPDDNISGITAFKRILNKKKKVDVFQGKTNPLIEGFDEINSYINNRIYLDLDCELDEPSCIFKVINPALSLLKKNYANIYSRSWIMQNHLVALEYKFLNPKVFWTAEFSDPLVLNISNKVRNSKKMLMDNQEYVERINKQINQLNISMNSSFPLIENKTSIFWLTEYLTYLFADKIIFTNENQRIVMLNQFPKNVSEFVANKSCVEMHPTLTKDFYNIKEFNQNLNENYINIAYFGRDYYGQRHFESLFYSIDSLNHKYKDKLRIYIFINDTELLKKLISSLNCPDNFIINKPLSYFEFLNATTKFDVLMVNDVSTNGIWPINPYLPSKLSDYLGSSTDIWALYEEGSSLSNFDLKYKSRLNDFKGCRNQLIKIFDDFGYKDKNYSFNEDYTTQRLTELNKLVEYQFNANLKLKKENKSLKLLNKEILSSNSWKLTKPLRRFRNK